MALNTITLYLSSWFIITYSVLSTVSSENATSAYSELGLFENVYPWLSFTRPALAALDPGDVDTTFYFANSGETNFKKVETWPKIEFSVNDIKKATFFITHGYQSGVKANWFPNLTQAIMNKTNGNVFTVDWSKGASGNYLRAISNTRIVGAEIARVIQYLASEKSMNLKNIHLLGHSLGSHIMSYVGKKVAGIGRITALDPAGPMFNGRHPMVRLDSNDSNFVDVIHTDGRFFVGLGMRKSVGKVDFFFNGGLLQPNCLFQNVSTDLKTLLNVPKITMQVLVNMASCSHTRSPSYMAGAIAYDCMKAYPFKSDRARLIYASYTDTDKKCTNQTCTVVGLETVQHPEATGTFLVETTGFWPYCVAQENCDTTEKPSRGVFSSIFHHVASIWG